MFTRLTGWAAMWVLARLTGRPAMRMVRFSHSYSSSSSFGRSSLGVAAAPADDGATPGISG
jgi:hypothetical protein